MSLRSAVVLVLVCLLVVPVAHAQEPSDLWRTFAERLAPGSFVVVNLKNGTRLQGRVVQVASETMTLLPKTRIAVLARTLAFADVQSIDLRKEGMSPGAKVLIGVGSAGGILMLLAVVALAVGR
jgi:hypothetical protein